jgi:hypothetical protein
MHDTAPSYFIFAVSEFLNVSHDLNHLVDFYLQGDPKSTVYVPEVIMNYQNFKIIVIMTHY